MRCSSSRERVQKSPLSRAKLGPAAVGLALLLLLPASVMAVSNEATFDLYIHSYCAPGTNCDQPSAEAYRISACKAAQELNRQMSPTGFSFRPTIFPIDSTSPAVPPPGNPPDKQRYYQMRRCGHGEEADSKLRGLWLEEVAFTQPHVISMMLNPVGVTCCSPVADPNKKTSSLYVIQCATQLGTSSGLVWNHEMGHHWGLPHTHRCDDTADTYPQLPVTDYDSLITDVLGPVLDTPGDPCRFESYREDENGLPVPGKDEDADGNLIDVHEWCEETVKYDVDTGSPWPTYCEIQCYRSVNGQAVPLNSITPPLPHAAMSYYNWRCKGSPVVGGQSLDSLTPDSVARIRAVRTGVVARMEENLPNVCANLGGDSDSDGICDFDDMCPFDPDTCQLDSDGDGTGDGCDLCPYDPAPTGDLDKDGIGDACDPDKDGDGCFNHEDQHPSQAILESGTVLAGMCSIQKESWFYSEAIDSDGDGIPNCKDLDDDNDRICDEGGPFASTADNGVLPLGCVEGEGGSDTCPDDPEDQCHNVVAGPADCPPHWLTCAGTSCQELFAMLLDPGDPDPTHALRFDLLDIVNRSLFLSPAFGQTASQGAWAMADLAAQQLATQQAATQTVAQAAEVSLATRRGAAPVLRLELWSERSGERVAVVGEFPAEQVHLGAFTQGGTLVLTPRAERDGSQSLVVESTHQIGVRPAAEIRDRDGDGFPDAVDNCAERANPRQLDSDEDGFGNACDADLDGDGEVGEADLEAIQSCFGADLEVDVLGFIAGDVEGEEDGAGEGQIDFAALRRQALCQPADLNEDFRVDDADLRLAEEALGGSPGPSALAVSGRR